MYWSFISLFMSNGDAVAEILVNKHSDDRLKLSVNLIGF